MSFGELCVVVILGIVVIGPKDLPRYLRKAGQLAGKIRRMATDVRAQSGIDEVLRSEGLSKDIAEIRRLTSGEFIASTARSAGVGVTSAVSAPARTLPAVTVPEPVSGSGLVVVREREYPREGADAYEAITDSSIVYAPGLPRSSFARDALYVMGDAEASLPPLEPEAEPLVPDEPSPPDGAHAEGDAAPTPSAEHA